MEDEVLDRCCGLDVHRKTVVGCLLVRMPDRTLRREVRTWGTTTGELLQLADWLAAEGCTHVGMEATGSYWKPVYNLLEDRFTLIVANPGRVRMIPSRKTDMRDAEWIATLLQRGMLPKSAIPSRSERELRELTRYRSSLVTERAAEVNRVQKVLEGANVKLGTVASNVMGVSGREMLRAMVAGSENPRLLAGMARGRLAQKQDALAAALEGAVGQHQRFLLRIQLAHIDELDRLIEEVNTEIDERMRPFQETLDRLQTIPGIGKRNATIVLAELGTDLRHFESADKLASWAGVCPGMDESAGKRRSARTPKGSRWLKAAMTEAGHAAGRSHTTLGERYRRFAPRIGKKKAALATGHMIIRIVFHVIRDGATYDDTRFAPDERQKTAIIRHHVRRLERLGYAVTLSEVA